MTIGHAVRMADLTWTEFDEIAQRVPYWVLVTGSVEQHGPHLPLGADTMVVERLAELSSAGHGSVILGVVGTGVLYAYRDWPGQRVPTDVLSGQFHALAETATCFSNRLLVFNGHDENHEVLMAAARDLNDRHGTDVVVVEWAQLVKDVIREVSDSRSEAHAGEALTSVFLHWYPERVRADRIAPGLATEAGLTQEDLHVTRKAHHVRRRRRDEVPTGVVGDPTPATEAKGAVICAALVDRVDQLVREREWVRG